MMCSMRVWRHLGRRSMEEMKMMAFIGNFLEVKEFLGGS